MPLDCQQISQKLAEIFEDLSSFDEKFWSGNIGQAKKWQTSILSEINEILPEIRDDDLLETATRAKIAKEKGYDYVGTFTPRRALAFDHQGDGILVDRTGKEICRLGGIDDFSGFRRGLAWISEKRAEGGWRVYRIDQSGKRIKIMENNSLEIVCDSVDFSGFPESGLVNLKVQEGQGFRNVGNVFLDHFGDEPFVHNFEPLTPMLEDRAWVIQRGFHQTLTIIRSDPDPNEWNMVLDFGFRFDEKTMHVEPFQDGVAWLRLNKNYILYSKNGDLLYQDDEISGAGNFVEDRAIILWRGGYYLIDKSGEKKAGPFELADDLNGGAAPVYKQDGDGINYFTLVDKDGNELLQHPVNKFSHIRNFTSGVFFAKESGRNHYILIDKSGQKVSDIIIKEIISIDSGNLAYIKDLDFNIYTINTKGKKVFNGFRSL